MKNHIILSFSDICDFLGLATIGLLIILFSFFSSHFAKLHITITALSFPIFVSECALIWLSTLLIVKIIFRWQWRIWYWGVLLYIAWVVAATVSGYHSWGPITFRHAALFYYPLFLLFGASFYNERFIKNIAIAIIFLIFTSGAMPFKFVDNYYWFTCNVLAGCLIAYFFPKQRLWLIPVAVFFSHWDLLFQGSRAHMAGIAASLIYLFLIAVCVMKQFSLKLRMITLAVVLCLFVGGMLRFADHNALKSMSNLAQLKKLYQGYALEVEKKKQTYKPKAIKYKIYNDDPSLSFINEIEHKKEALETISEKVFMVDHKEDCAKNGIGFDNIRIFRNPELKKIIPERIVSFSVIEIQPNELMSQPISRDLVIAYHNILFRVFIWRDMFAEVLEKGVFTGVGFGQPQRSRSIEILGWAIEEWNRDGWISMHNSYCNMFYRAGILGLLMTVALIYALFYLTKQYLQRRLFYGIFLVSVLIYWCVLALFSVVFEVPYFAVTFWSLLGFGFAYARQYKGSFHVSR